jgi:hypothetical protein
MPKPKTKPDDEAQSQRFIEDARKIGAAEDDSAADALMSELARRPPDPKKGSKRG